MTTNLSSYAHRILTTANPCEKARLTQQAAAAFAATQNAGTPQAPPPRPSRPPLPKIIPASQIPSVKNSSAPSNIYYLHALAHVELNAIDLCFDTMLRFSHTQPAIRDLNEWYSDWISIASDEARHFSHLQARLRANGSSYGALPAHDLVWKSAEASTHSRKMRLALGQLVAEAKGIDAGPKLAARLVGTGDVQSADVVSVIAKEEVRHVRIGVKWFLRECELEGVVDAISEFHDIAVRHANPGAFARPFNEERRRQAGLTPDWYLPVADIMAQQREDRRLQNEMERKQKSVDGVAVRL